MGGDNVCRKLQVFQCFKYTYIVYFYVGKRIPFPSFPSMYSVSLASFVVDFRPGITLSFNRDPRGTSTTTPPSLGEFHGTRLRLD